MEPLLSIEEKREWLATVFRNVRGEYTQADQFKALIEDTKLAVIQEEMKSTQTNSDEFEELINSVQPPKLVTLTDEEA